MTENWLTPAEAGLWRQWVDVQWKLERRLSEQLRPFGLTHGEYAILSILEANGPTGCRMTRLGELTQNPKTRLTQQVRRLEQAHLVSRAAVEEDARGVRVVLTDEGRRVLAAAAPGHSHVVRELVVGHIGEEDARVFARVLRDIENRLDAQGQAAGS